MYIIIEKEESSSSEESSEEESSEEEEEKKPEPKKAEPKKVEPKMEEKKETKKEASYFSYDTIWYDEKHLLRQCQARQYQAQRRMHVLVQYSSLLGIIKERLWLQGV